MRFATWNVNSLKVRQERVEQWLADISPDVVCMQETKLADDAFPTVPGPLCGWCDLRAACETGRSVPARRSWDGVDLA